MATKYRYMGCENNVMIWESVLPIAPNESRHEVIACPWNWFWGKR